LEGAIDGLRLIGAGVCEDPDRDLTGFLSRDRWGALARKLSR
jgi:hypothetical protein